MEGNTKLSEFNGNYASIFLRADEYANGGTSEYDGKSLETFLTREVKDDDYEDLTLEEINETLEEYGLCPIDFDDEAFDQIRDTMFPNHSDEELEEELEGYID